ncbi:MAG: SDR family oxidoreductase [Gammaproteobacteria bacterium]|nr:SDR family oxidoreductase [Gammaproteobacteria bacterium]
MSVRLPITPSFRLDGKRALVTGAGRGLGLAAAAALAEYGAHVTLAARTRSEIESAAEAIRARGQLAEAMVMDVLDFERTGQAIAEQPAYQILVNNAGTGGPVPMPEVTKANYDTIMDLNVKGAYFVAQSVVRGMLEAGEPGSIINVSSQMGHIGSATRTVYCTSKHAIEGLTKSMALELAPNKIRVNTICPTFVETPLTRPHLARPELRSEVLTGIKLGRLGQVEDIMGVVVFLASEAASLVTGASYMIDGGWTAH